MDDLASHRFDPWDADRVKAVLDKWGVQYAERRSLWFWRKLTIASLVPAGAHRELQALFRDVLESEQAW